MKGCCRRRKRGRFGRNPKPVVVRSIPQATTLKPEPSHCGGEPIYLDLAEVEALKLIDIEKLSFREAEQLMGVSRSTIWRLVNSAREKIARAIIECREIRIEKPENT
ncbi:MAG: DUF134 domain-containing protein [Desulfurococcaceae archaeon TW002]